MMADDENVKDLEKWKKLVSSESDKQLESDIKAIPREVVMELARDPVLGPKISDAINKAMGKDRSPSSLEGAQKSAGASAAASAVRARQQRLAKEEKEEQEKKLSLQARIQRMDVGEKAKLAREGDQAARAILVKDGSKTVFMAVLTNPKITVQEIETFAASRNVSEDILREIAGNRDWIKNYTVMLSLVNNPKTPVSMALSFLPRLLTRDLRFLGKSKGVPEVIRVTARKLAQKRQI